eukprot:3560934-Ditylum_brightwellii.AAC.1
MSRDMLGRETSETRHNKDRAEQAKQTEGKSPQDLCDLPCNDLRDFVDGNIVCWECSIKESKSGAKKLGKKLKEKLQFEYHDDITSK